VREADNPTTFMCRMSWKSGRLNLLEPSGPHRACYGTALPLGYTVSSDRATDDRRDSEGNRRYLTKFLSPNFPGRTENKIMNASVRMSGVRAQIRTVCYPSSSLRQSLLSVTDHVA